MYHLDSNAFIYPALYDGPKASSAGSFLRSVVGGETAAATASSTLDEVIWFVSQNAPREEAVRQGERILKFPNLQILDVGSRELVRVISLMDTHDVLTPRDAIHLATMTEHGIETIVSDDDDFDAVGDVSRIGLENLEIGDDG